jgi:putative SOS response-associated peptidase YedK
MVAEVCLGKVAPSPMFREAYKSRRCIVPADAFYEWKKLGEGPKAPKQPYTIGRADGEPLVLAGLWETWKPKDGGQPVWSFTIITTTPNATKAEIHNRMPVRTEYSIRTGVRGGIG